MRVARSGVGAGDGSEAAVACVARVCCAQVIVVAHYRGELTSLCYIANIGVAKVSCVALDSAMDTLCASSGIRDAFVVRTHIIIVAGDRCRVAGEILGVASLWDARICPGACQGTT